MFFAELTSSWKVAPVELIVMSSLENTGPHRWSPLANTTDPSSDDQYANLAKLSCDTSSRRTKPVPLESRASETMLANRPNCPVVEPDGPAYTVTLIPRSG